MTRSCAITVRRGRCGVGGGALGYDVWMIRWVAFIYAGFWGAVSGVLFVYYHKYIHPVSLSLANSAEGLLAVIAGLYAAWHGPDGLRRIAARVHRQAAALAAALRAGGAVCSGSTQHADAIA